MRTAVEIAREALARLAEQNGAPHTAGLYRDGRYDEQGLMPSAIDAAELALREGPGAVAMNRFCDRVERGEVRSRRTYAEFCEILGREPRQ